jgi:hypothetical protein
MSLFLAKVLRVDAWSAERGNSVDDFEAIFLDDRVGEDFFGNPLELFLRFVAVPAIEIQDEEFSLAYIFHRGVTEAGKSVLDGLSLGVEDGAFWHHPNVCFHWQVMAQCRLRAALGHRTPFKPCMPFSGTRLNDDLRGVACVG